MPRHPIKRGRGRGRGPRPGTGQLTLLESMNRAVQDRGMPVTDDEPDDGGDDSEWLPTAAGRISFFSLSLCVCVFDV